MKKFAVILAVIFLAFALNAFAVIHDNTPISSRTGTGHFELATWQALSVTGANVNMGSFVIGADYTGLSYAMNFAIVGQPNQTAYYHWNTNLGWESSNDVHIVLDKADGYEDNILLSSTGTGTITITCTQVHVPIESPANSAISIVEELIVSYNNDL